MIHVPFLLILTYDKLPNSITRETVYGSYGCTTLFSLITRESRDLRKLASHDRPFSSGAISTLTDQRFPSCLFLRFGLRKRVQQLIMSQRSRIQGTNAFSVCVCNAISVPRSPYFPTATDTLKNLRILNI